MSPKQAKVLETEKSTAPAKRSANKITKSKKSKTVEVPRGMPKSNRPWKTPKKKFASIKKTVNRLSYEKKMELRSDLRHVKELSKGIKDQRKEDVLQKHHRRVENAERRLANERRSEVVQVIKNTSKLKRMKKKQMRMVEKRDLSQVKLV